jgi:hypothetical protein
MPDLSYQRNFNVPAERWHLFYRGAPLGTIALCTLNHLPSSNARPLKAANDNELTWPFIPFPNGWYAAC